MLPYTSIEEAQAALGGRELTWLETWWFNTTAAVRDDVILLWTLGVLLITLHVAGLALLAVESRFAGTKWAARHKIQSSEHLDGPTLRHFYVKVMASMVGVMGPVIWFGYPVFKTAGIRMSLPLPTAAEMAAQMGVYFIVEEFALYWVHRWLHTPWLYYKIHYVHHAIKAPVFPTGLDTHPIELFVVNGAMFLGMVIVPPHVVTLWAWVVVSSLLLLEVHCGYDFPTPTNFLIPFYGGAKLHDLHHSHGGRPYSSNYGVGLWVFDIIYGTYKRPRHFMKARQSKQKEVEKNVIPRQI